MQRVKSENDVRYHFPPLGRHDTSRSGSSPSAEQYVAKPRRPGSARSDKERSLSGSQLQCSQPGSRAWSGVSELRISEDGERSCKGDSRGADRYGSLMPIVQRTATSPGLGPKSATQGTGFAGIASGQPPPNANFKRRLTSNKSGHTPQSRSRVQQLSTESFESDSPKGMDRALTPSMLKSLRRDSVPNTSGTPCKQQGRASHYESSFAAKSFSSRPSRREINTCYDDITASFRPQSQDILPDPLSSTLSTSHGMSRREEVAQPQRQNTLGRSGSLNLHNNLSGQNSAQPSQWPSTETEHRSDPEGVLHRAESSTSEAQKVAAGLSLSSGDDRIHASRPSTGVIADDHVQDFLRRKLLNINTARDMEAEENAFHGHNNSSIPAGPATRKPAKLIRYNVTRINRRSFLGLSKVSILEMYNMKGKLRLYAERESGSHTNFAIFSPASGSGKRRLEATLVASKFAENQFLLISTSPSSPVAACDPDQDPVIMAVQFQSGLQGQRTVTVLLPDNKASSAGENDLGSKHRINDHFTKYGNGEVLNSIRVLLSVPGKEMIGARSARPSVKNTQLQEAPSFKEWPSATPKFSEPPTIAKKGSSKVVFEFGRLRHAHEFVCDYMSPVLEPVQALGLAVACSAPKRTFLYL